MSAEDPVGGKWGAGRPACCESGHKLQATNPVSSKKVKKEKKRKQIHFPSSLKLSSVLLIS
jgi:hypothetical protein